VVQDVLKVSVGSPTVQEVEVPELNAKVTPDGGVYAVPGVVVVPAAPTTLQVTVEATVSLQLIEYDAPVVAPVPPARTGLGDCEPTVTVEMLSVNRSCAVSPEVCPVAVITKVTPPSASPISKL
jgi:hypothetical protein